MTAKRLFARTALLPTGWVQDLRIEIAADGSIAALTPNAKGDGAERVAGPLLPGMANLHCHSFQRAMAGLAERTGPAGDDFWSWREVMYRFLDRLSPEQIEAVAAELYVEMLKAGYTSVAEFHYVHNDPRGAAYDNPAETAERIAAASARTGIRLTLLPVLYQTSNFGGAAPLPGQRRFIKSTDAFLALVERLAARRKDGRGFTLGFAPHSLRAAPPDSIKAVLSELNKRDSGAPIHIHVAEQEKEVRDCIAWSGMRPVQWLLDAMEIDQRWVFVHATHMSADETRRLAQSGAVVGLCPTTEGNLGDGFFPFRDYIEAGGRYGIGSDSNISVDPTEELRWLDYGQRLAREQRSLGLDPPGVSIGAALWRTALAGGAQALGQAVGGIAVGAQADFIVLDDTHPILVGRSGDRLIDSLIFAGARNAVRDVMVAGSWVVRDGCHPEEARVAAAYREVAKSLTDA